METPPPNVAHRSSRGANSGVMFVGERFSGNREYNIIYVWININICCQNHSAPTLGTRVVHIL